MGISNYSVGNPKSGYD